MDGLQRLWLDEAHEQEGEDEEDEDEDDDDNDRPGPPSAVKIFDLAHTHMAIGARRMKAEIF